LLGHEREEGAGVDLPGHLKVLLALEGAHRLLGLEVVIGAHPVKEAADLERALDERHRRSLVSALEQNLVLGLASKRRVAR